MSVFRVKKNTNYTVMSNYHLKDKNISLKAKGLLSVILSLPEDWNYSIRGLSAILMEGITAVSNILKELEAAGYIERSLIRDASGKITDTEYVIYEQPEGLSVETMETMAKPQTEKPRMDFPCLADRDAAYTDTDDGNQLNTNIINTKKTKTNLSITEDTKNTDRQTDGMPATCKAESHEDIREQLAENIDYASLVIDEPENRELIDECLSLMADVLEEGEDKIRISGKNVPYCTVKDRFFKLTREHMQYVLESLQKTTCCIKNIRSYLITVLYNAGTTMNLYYRQKVNHDMCGGGWQEQNGFLSGRLEAALSGFQVKEAVT